jgi:hypothetical protein
VTYYQHPYNTSEIVASLCFQRPLKANTEMKGLNRPEFAGEMRESCATAVVLRNCAES